MNDTVIHVSAKTGNNQWSGALARPNRSRADGPLATLEAAQKAVRNLKAQRDIPGTIRVLIADGCYELNRPLRFGPEDGGEIPPHRVNWNDCGKVVSYEAATAFAGEWPAETAWKHALALPPFVSNNGDPLPSEGHAEMLKAGGNLFIRVTAKRPTDWRPSAVARVWDKEYCAVILCPSVSDLRKGLQIGVSSDGDAECLLQPSSAPVQPDWSFTLDRNPTEWTVVFRIGVKSAAETCQVAATPACALMVACRQAPSEMNMKDWRKTLGQDVHSLEADPLFVNPHKGDFRLKPGSPALKTGFVPFDLSGVGPRKTQ